VPFGLIYGKLPSMQIVPEILKKVELVGAQLLAITKYFSPQETQYLFEKLKNGLKEFQKIYLDEQIKFWKTDLFVN
jgi:hypothetical protein